MATPIEQGGWGPSGPTPPWATGQNATTADLVQQVSNGAGPASSGTYNPMYHQANDQPITMKDLASLYYKSQGQGIVGDNPHPFRAANEYSKVGLGDAGLIGMTGAWDSPVKNAKDARQLLQAQIDLAGGNREAVFNQLVGKTNQKLVAQDAAKAGVSSKEALALQGQAPNAAGDGTNGFEQAGMQNWAQEFVAPYIQENQERLRYQADMFDQVASSIIPTMDPNKAEIMKAYLPLISQAYHQKADSFAADFLQGTGPTSMFGQLMKQQKRNASALNFLAKQQQLASGGSGSSGGGGFASLLNLATK